MQMKKATEKETSVDKERWILVVEDHQALGDAVAAILEEDGYRVLRADNGREALQMMEQRRPDLIVSDILMPEMGGHEFYQRVRDRPEWVSLPFIYLTVKADPEDMLKGKALGVDGYLTKPLDPQELLVTVRAQLDRAEAIQDAAESGVEELKEQLITVLGHELRTPLTYIRCYADLAMESASTLEDSGLEECWSGVRLGADRLTDLTEDVVLLSRLDTERARAGFRNKMRVHDDLDEILELVVNQHLDRAAEKGIILRAEIDPDLPSVRIYAPIFADALSRLVENAIKFSRQEGMVVTVRAREMENWVEVTITDQGVGIPSDEIPQLFERFHQIGRKDMEQQGLGLGLAIAKQLIDLHDGEIVVESEPGRGSSFTVRLPIVQG